MSKLVSMRLESELASWVESYREERGWSRAELIDAALRSFRQDTERSVPSLPARPRVIPAAQAEREAQAAERKRIEDAAAQEMRKAIGLRQQRLNEDKARRLAAS